MRIRVRRVGGFTGNVALTAEFDSATLPAAAGARLESAVGSLPWGRPPGAPAHPDAFRYEIDLPDEPQRGLAVLGERDMAGPLSLLGEHLTAHGVMGPSRRPGS